MPLDFSKIADASADVNQTDRHQFLSTWFSGCAGDIEIRILPAGKQGFFPIDDLQGIDAYASKFISTNVFFGVATRNGNAGTKANVLNLPGAWADVDFKNGKEKCEKLLKECPLTPTYLIRTGGGYHPYWKFREPTDNIQTVERINRQLGHYFESDPVHNADRVLRLPDTWNFKYDPKRPVELLIYNPALEYNESDFEEHFPPVKQYSSSSYNAPGWEKDALKGANDGNRHGAMTKLIGRYITKGLTDEEILPLVEAIDARNNPPLAQEENLLRFIQGVRRTDERNHPPQETPPDEGLPEEIPIHSTDLGNATRFAAKYGDYMRHNWDTGKWLYYDGIRWNPHTGKAVANRFASTVARDILKEANKIVDSEERKKVAKWSFTSESNRKIKDMLELAKAIPPIECYSNQFDTDQFLLNIKNGTVDLRTGELRAHNPDDMISKLAPVAWEGEESSFDDKQLWFGCLATWMEDDRAAIDYLQRLGGMCLTGDITSRVFPIFWGTGKNGKNVFLDTLKGIMGDYATPAPQTLLRAARNEEHTTEIAELKDMRLVVASETKKNMKLKTALVKAMTGDQQLKGRFMRQDNFKFDITHKTILMTQNLPVIDEITDAIWDRVHKVEWRVRIPDDKQDAKLTDKLKAEWPFILGWFIKGCLKWQEDGYLKPTEGIKEDTREYREEMNPLKDFIEERCIKGRDNFIPVRELKKEFDEFNTDKRQLSGRDFNAYMTESGYIYKLQRIGEKPVKCWLGLRLRENDDE